MNLRMALQQVSLRRYDLKSGQVNPKLKYCSGLSSICLSFIPTIYPKFYPIFMPLRSMNDTFGLIFSQSSSSLSSFFLNRPTVSCFRPQVAILQQCLNIMVTLKKDKFRMHQQMSTTQLSLLIALSREPVYNNEFWYNFIVIESMQNWMNKMKLEGDSLQMQMIRQKSRRQYVNYHQSNKYHPHISPHLLMMKPIHKNNGASPQSGSKLMQIMSPISAQKSLIIKNMHLQHTGSRQFLPKVANKPQKHLFTYITTNKIQQNQYQKHPKHVINQNKSRVFSKGMHNSRFRIKQSYRMKTEEININISQKQQKQSHTNQTKLRRLRNSKDQIEKISRQISKSFVLNDLLPSHQVHKLQINGHSEAQIKQSLLFENQSNYLKINKLSPKNVTNKLYFTQNAGDYLEQFNDQILQQSIKKTSVINK